MSTHVLEYTNRICDTESMTNKLIYQIRKEQLSAIELQKLQNRCNNELRELRHELDELLQELRIIADRYQSSARSPRIAA